MIFNHNKLRNTVVVVFLVMCLLLMVWGGFTKLSAFNFAFFFTPISKNDPIQLIFFN